MCKVETICRLCASAKENNIKLFDRTAKDDKLVLKVKLLVGVNILEEDPLPHAICRLCVDKIWKFAEFKELCEDSQVNLAVQFGQLENNVECKLLTSFKVEVKENLEKDQQILEDGFLEDNIDKDFIVEENLVLDEGSPLSNYDVNNILDPCEEGLVLQKKPLTKHKNVSSTCSLCSKTLSSRKALKTHLMGGIHGDDGRGLWNKLKRIKKIILCSQCGAEFDSKSNLAKHTQETHSINSRVKYVTKHLSSFNIEDIETFLSKKLENEELELYLGLIAAGKDMEIFSKIFRTDFTRASERIWKCDQCLSGKFTGNLNKYMEHFEMHDNRSISFKCELCKLKTSTFKMYSAHLRFFHFIDYKCEICGEILRNKNLYKSHMNMVHSVEEHKCPICNKTYTKKSTMEVHINQIHNDPKYMCSVCGKSFKSNGQLNIHVRDVHSTKTYSCDECGSFFKAESYLLEHKKSIHAKLRTNHHCDICGKGPFSYGRVLKNHIRRIHYQEKNVSCTLCSKKFFDRSLLRIHMTSHSTVTYHDCHNCGMSFKTYNNLKRHLVQMHNEKLPPKNRKNDSNKDIKNTEGAV